MTTPKAREDLMRVESKKPGNKPCLICSKPGPHATVVLAPDTYFFVCQTCGGAHRAVPHKVKTVGMTDFTPVEVEQVQKGGNREAKRFWHARLSEMPFNADLNDAKNVAQFIKLTFTDRKYIPLDGQRPAPLKKVAAPKSELKRTNTGATGHVAAPLSTPGHGHVHHEHVAAPATTGGASRGGGGVDILGGLSSFEFTEAPPTHVEPGAPAGGNGYVQPPLTAIHTPSSATTPVTSATYTQPPLTAIHKPAGSPVAAITPTPPATPAMPPGFAAALKISVGNEAVEQLSRGFTTIVRQYQLTPLQLYGAVHQAMVSMLGNHMTALTASLASTAAVAPSSSPSASVSTPVTPAVAVTPSASISITSPNGNTFSASGGFPDFEMPSTTPVTSPPTAAPVSGTPAHTTIMDDPLAGIGETSRRDSGNPFDDEDDVVPTPAALQNTPPASVVGGGNIFGAAVNGNGNAAVTAPVTAIHTRKGSAGFDPLQGLPSFDGPAPSFETPKPPQPAVTPPTGGNAFGGNAWGVNGNANFGAPTNGVDTRPRGYSNVAPPVGGVGMPGMVGVGNNGMGNMGGNPMGNGMVGNNNGMMAGGIPMNGTPQVVLVGYDPYGQPIYQPAAAAAANGMMRPPTGAFGGVPAPVGYPGGVPGMVPGGMGYPGAPTGAFGGAPVGYPGASPNGAFNGATPFGGATAVNGGVGGMNAFGVPNGGVNGVATAPPPAVAAPKRPELFSFLNPL